MEDISQRCTLLSAKRYQVGLEIAPAIDDEALMYAIKSLNLHEAGFEHEEAQDRASRIQGLPQRLAMVTTQSPLEPHGVHLSFSRLFFCSLLRQRAPYLAGIDKLRGRRQEKKTRAQPFG